MSQQDYHQGIFSFPNGFERSQQEEDQQEDHNHIAQQIRRDKMRLQGFEPPPPLVAVEEGESSVLPPVGYNETAGMLSEMFNFTPSGTDMTSLENQLSQSYRHHHRPTPPPPPTTNDWYNLGPLDEIKDQHQHQQHLHNHNHNHHHQQHHHQQQQQQINAAESAVAMQLFLMNPQSTARSPSPSPSSHHPPPPSAASSTSSTLHMLLPNQGFHPSPTGGHFGPTNQYTWGDHQVNVENQGLSLSLSTSLQHLEAVGKAEEELRMEQGGMLFFNQDKNFGALQMGGGQNPNHIGYGSSIGAVNHVLRSSKYAKATQELLEEFCSVGRGQFKKNKLVRQEIITNINPNQNPTGSGGGGGGNSSSSSKDVPPPPPPPPPALSSTDRLEHQRRKVKLLSMLDEVDKRYNHYCEQMQMVVNSFDLVMGFGAAIPYTALAQKAMSRHFRCLKDAIAVQLRQSCEVLGEKDAGTSGVTKGETPRLRLLEQSLRQQRAFHQMGMMEQEAWRPQRGLPERSVNILRAWLFEHFLHPYPSDADKHLLARQTGLSRNQVSNWFINARVRLWKPMVEEMYQQESKDIDEEDHTPQINPTNAQTPIQNTTTTATATATTATPTPTSATTIAKRTEFNDTENDPSLIAINRQHLNNSSSFAAGGVVSASLMPISPPSFSPTSIQESDFRAGAEMSLTLGLRHAGNLPDKSNFVVRDFGGF